MDATKAARNWKLTTAVLFVAVVVILLLWPKIRQAAGDLIFGPLEIGGINLGDIRYPDINIIFEDGGGTDGEITTGSCGCDSHGQQLIDDAMAFFIAGMRDIQSEYLAGILAARPDWAIQYWNNTFGYDSSNAAGALFGGNRDYSGRGF